jgi:hypothetical protein
MDPKERVQHAIGRFGIEIDDLIDERCTTPLGQSEARAIAITYALADYAQLIKDATVHRDSESREDSIEKANKWQEAIIQARDFDDWSGIKNRILANARLVLESSPDISELEEAFKVRATTPEKDADLLITLAASL